jgi:hypothetical protein
MHHGGKRNNKKEYNDKIMKSFHSAIVVGRPLPRQAKRKEKCLF